jgi:hypothetical protein
LIGRSRAAQLAGAAKALIERDKFLLLSEYE